MTLCLLCNTGVQRLKVGDAVFGLAPGCFGPAVVLPAALMVQMPQGLNFIDAATLPTVFVTVYTAFGPQGLSAEDKVTRCIAAYKEIFPSLHCCLSLFIS